MIPVWRTLPAWCRRVIGVGGAAVGGLLAIALLTVGVTETVCRAPSTAQTAAWRPIVDPADRRDEVNSYLTYPEWAVVHAYEDLAGVMRRGSESDFRYGPSIRVFWSSLCQVKKNAAAHGPIAFDYNAALYIIGASFTAEMGLKGIYETTFGRLTANLRGPVRTPEDDFALVVADDYAAFLRQVPWYQYPFGATLRRLWTETPLTGGHPIRKLERRFALSSEYAAKGIYAKAIAWLAGFSPAPLAIRSVVTGKTLDGVLPDKRINVIRRLPDGNVLIETPRYREFTEIIRALSAHGADFVEIAGNRNILVTAIAPTQGAADPTLARRLFSVPLQARPGLARVGYDVKVDELTEFVRRLQGTAVILEHVYDY